MGVTEFKFDNKQSKKGAEKATDKVVEPIKSDELGDVDQATAPQDGAELTDNTQEEQGDTQETATEQPVEQPKEKATKVVLTYIGIGVWRDSKGDVWSQNVKEGAMVLNSRTYGIEEYEGRKDLKFMVGYGEMKSITV